MKEKHKKKKMLLHPPPPLPQTNHILMSKTTTEFDDICIVRIFLGIVGEPQLSDKNFHVLRGIDLNKTIKTPDNRAHVWVGGASDEVQPKAQV